ncbi:hypothetical protein EDEG_01794 [Edhazardia aedis USNM 41457]|uniref:Uncharacterized protein n=1 Tax=Edhazardia aedis (strain USNM 41457) TaxID=1003232 RepID=J9D7Z7_EDHAE|nr:hypothetical protein EDEG_01794 [Edhazardia aedis USNM 41457]|eukprot:EJW03916.1 hypothetical protein EDEG_01794 [Edhazardia aedis USNM 41457]
MIYIKYDKFIEIILKYKYLYVEYCEQKMKFVFFVAIMKITINVRCSEATEEEDMQMINDLTNYLYNPFKKNFFKSHKELVLLRNDYKNLNETIKKMDDDSHNKFEKCIDNETSRVFIILFCLENFRINDISKYGEYCEGSEYKIDGHRKLYKGFKQFISDVRTLYKSLQNQLENEFKNKYSEGWMIRADLLVYPIFYNYENYLSF